MSFADRVLAGLGPTFTAQAGPLLADLVGALVSEIEATDELLQPAVGGWAGAFDLTTTPDPTWLGRLTGTPLPGGLTLAEQRAYILARPNWRRGTPAALLAAVAATLTGTRNVEITERDGSPWQLTIHTFEAETPDPDASLAAALTQKPVGIVLDYEVVAGANYQHFRDIHGPTFAADAVRFPTPFDMYTHIPE